MLDGFEGWHLVIIVVIAVVLFGSGKLPGAARSMGQSLRIFKAEMKAGASDGAKVAAEAAPAEDGTAAAPPVLEGRIVTDSVADATTQPQSVPQPAPQPAPQPVPLSQSVPQNVSTQP